jgi:hypothetical protein
MPTDAPSPDVASRDAAVEAAVDTPPVDPAGVSRVLYRYLLGRFDSSAQSMRDPTYFAISVVTCRVQVAELGEQVMYIEQARVGMAPYRQRVYVIEPREPASTHAVSRVFEFNRPQDFVGLCAEPSRYTIEAADLIERAGCAVEVTWMGDRFVGGTVERRCESTLMGATYATSEVVIRADGFSSWDRGFNALGRQVWGATAGAYVFDRRSMIEPAP